MQTPILQWYNTHQAIQVQMVRAYNEKHTGRASKRSGKRSGRREKRWGIRAVPSRESMPEPTAWDLILVGFPFRVEIVPYLLERIAALSPDYTDSASKRQGRKIKRYVPKKV